MSQVASEKFSLGKKGRQMRCENTDSCLENRPIRFVATHFFKIPGEIKEEYRNRDFRDLGFFVSQDGGLFCDRSCWSRFCED